MWALFSRNLFDCELKESSASEWSLFILLATLYLPILFIMHVSCFYLPNTLLKLKWLYLLRARQHPPMHLINTQNLGHTLQGNKINKKSTIICKALIRFKKNMFCGNAPDFHCREGGRSKKRRWIVNLMIFCWYWQVFVYYK